jgi:hypothetical protein
MIDKDQRRALCELLRHLATGQISNDQFEDRLPACSDDPAIFEIRHQAWFLYSDLREHRLVGKDRLSDEDRRTIARWILFLLSDFEYEWPRIAWYSYPLLFLGNLMTLGLVGAGFRRTFERAGDFEVWPFVRRSDYETALNEPTYLRGWV